MLHCLRVSANAALILMLAACAAPPQVGSAASASAPMRRVKHLVVIYAENHSFDNLYGLFLGGRRHCERHG